MLETTGTRNRTRLFLLVTIVSLLLTGGSLVALSQSTVTAEEALSLFTEPIETADYLPDVSDTPELHRDTARLLYEGQGAQHWVAKGKLGEVCFATMFTDSTDDWIFGYSCMEPTQFARHGLYMRVATPNGARNVTLLPDGVDNAENRQAIEEAGGQMPVSNLAVFLRDNRPVDLTIRSTNGEPMWIGTPPERQP